MFMFTTWYDLHNSDHADVPTWRHRAPGKAAKTNARHWAKRYGEAKMLRADGSVLRYWLEEGKLRQRTYHSVIMH